MANSMPYSGLYYPCMTSEPVAGWDPYVEVDGEANNYGSAWYDAARAHSMATYTYTSSSPSPVGAMDLTPHPPAAAPAAWLENDMVPIVPVADGHHEPRRMQGYVDYALDGIYASSTWHHGMLGDGLEGTTLAMYGDATQMERGYSCGRDTSIDAAPISSQGVFMSNSAMLYPPLLPFMPTRSYTLDGAVTPVVRKARPVVDTVTTSTSPVSLAPTPASLSVPSPNTSNAATPASPQPPPQSPMEKVKQGKQSSAPAMSSSSAPGTAMTAVPTAVMTLPPPEPKPQAALMTKFATKPPFRHVSPPKLGNTDADMLQPTTWNSSALGETAVEDAAAGPKKKPAMACLFCRERKICCGSPAPDSLDARCKQCIKRGQSCTFPTECRRGHHKRTLRKATTHALAAATFPNDEVLANIITKPNEQPVLPLVEPAAGPSTSLPVKPTVVTQKIKVAAKRGRKLRMKHFEGVSKTLDKFL